ncbi:DUF6199 family natural product biosynthesis protein [Natranaerofaba carboxydovora]|uniref:DUF6199 family natural product biosynthesis protein n=1 Tax=Natranaerofaba carboxydovora TaxID=2742683 RepID=UPI001F147077|nr:DUF6199 family natural product biosynthesis protein [Natranaerofaba carboxydovora]UMZ74371.1 hypothetical protein ACONDI_01959 [Natranaerofaba carboxydovora]
MTNKLSNVKVKLIVIAVVIIIVFAVGIYSTVTDSGHSNGESAEMGLNPLGVIIFALGLLGVFRPKTVWYLEIGWKVKDTEPSELALIANRVIGGILLIIGLGLMFS